VNLQQNQGRMAVKKKVSTKPYTYFCWSVKKHEKPKNTPFEGVFAIPSSLSGKLLGEMRGLRKIQRSITQSKSGNQFRPTYFVYYQCY